jgi:hypothetical protein
MWMYPVPSCLDRPFTTELGDMKINTRIRGVHAYGADLNLGYGLIPLREGVDNPRSFDCLCQFLFLTVCMFLRRISCTLTSPRVGSPYLRMW